MSEYTLSERLCLQAADVVMEALGFAHPQVLRYGEPILVKESGRTRGAVQYKTFHPIRPRKITAFSQVWSEGSLGGKWVGGKVEICENGSCLEEVRFEVLWPGDDRYPGSEGNEPIVSLI